MTGNSNSGRFSRERYVGSREGYAGELAAFREVLDTAEVAGYPKPSFELTELARLIKRYPAEARKLLGDPPPEPEQG